GSLAGGAHFIEVGGVGDEVSHVLCWLKEKSSRIIGFLEFRPWFKLKSQAIGSRAEMKAWGAEGFFSACVHDEGQWLPLKPEIAYPHRQIESVSCQRLMHSMIAPGLEVWFQESMMLALMGRPCAPGCPPSGLLAPDIGPNPWRILCL